MVEDMEIRDIIPDSIAEEIGLNPGDKIIFINGKPIRDIIDYYFYEGEESLKLRVNRADGEDWELEIEKEPEEGLGIVFREDLPGGIKRCRNNCIFCFIDQLPEGMRETLYVKDDDYRHSFLHGNYISLTNLTRDEWERILKMRLSPLYVSFHTTSPRLRTKIFRNP